MHYYLAGNNFHYTLANMSYYIRVLGTENPDIHLDEILEAAAKAEPKMTEILTRLISEL